MIVRVVKSEVPVNSRYLNMDWRPNLTRAQKTMTYRALSGFYFFCGVVLLLAGVFVPAGWNQMKSKIYDGRVVVTSDSCSAYDHFIGNLGDPPLGEHTREAYIYDLQNPDEVVQGKHPRFIERGPYVYNAHKKKLNVTFQETEEDLMISYLDYEYYTFNREKTRADLDPQTDVVTIADPLLHTYERALRVQNPLITLFTSKDIVKGCIEKFNRTVFRAYTVEELLFGFNPDEFLKCTNFPIPFPGLLMNSTEEAVRTNAKTYNRTIYSGRDDKEKMWTYKAVGGEEYINKYAAPTQVGGTAGDAFPLFLSDTQKRQGLATWAPQAKRVMHLNFSREYSYMGVDLWEFIQDSSETTNDELNPKLFTYYMIGPPGVNDISFVATAPAAWEISPPIWISKPHFYQAEHYYQAIGAEASGVSRGNELASETFIGVEPVSGYVVDVQQRIQINLMINYNTKHLFSDKAESYHAAGARYGDISRYDIEGNCSWTGICGNMKESLLFPAAWFNQRGYMTKAGADQIKKNAAYQKLIEDDLPLMGPILGLVFIGAGVFLSVVNKQRSHIWVGFQRKSQEQDMRRKTITDEVPVHSPGEANVRTERASLLRKIAIASE